jgi:hypothetical protein
MKKSFTEETIRQCMDKLKECYPHLNEGLCQFMNVLGKIEDNYNHLAYPHHPNWRYSYPILPNYTLKDGSVVDIGIHVSSTMSPEWRISANFVTSNDGPDYYSGDISPTSEMYKVAMIQLKHWEFIDDAFILRRIANHNNFLEKFMQSDLTLWDMQDWIDGKS